MRNACSSARRYGSRTAASYTAPRWTTYHPTSQTGRAIAGRVSHANGRPPRRASAARISGVSPISRSGGAQSEIITFCSRWKRTRYSVAIVPSGELSAPTTSATPPANEAARHHGPGASRHARTYSATATAARTTNSGSNENDQGEGIRPAQA